MEHYHYQSITAVNRIFEIGMAENMDTKYFFQNVATQMFDNKCNVMMFEKFRIFPVWLFECECPGRQ